jgi:hypothetical protein
MSEHEHRFVEVVEDLGPEEGIYREIECAVCQITPDEAAMEEHDRQEASA